MLRSLGGDGIYSSVEESHYYGAPEGSCEIHIYIILLRSIEILLRSLEIPIAFPRNTFRSLEIISNY